MTEPMTVAAILGVISPILTAFIAQSHWKSQAKRWVALAVFVVMTLLAWGVTRFPTEGAVVLAELTTVIAAGQVAYTVIKQTRLLDVIEESTSRGRGAA